MQNKYLDAKPQGLGQDTYLSSSYTSFVSSHQAHATSSTTENKRRFLSWLVYKTTSNQAAVKEEKVTCAECKGVDNTANSSATNTALFPAI